MAGNHFVDRVEERACPDRAEQPPERAGRPDLREEGDRPAAVAWNSQAVAEDEPPAFVALLLRDRCEEAGRLRVDEPDEGQLPAPIEHGDDPRRPATELSSPRVDENRARECLRHREERTSLEVGLTARVGTSGVAVSLTSWPARARLEPEPAD